MERKIGWSRFIRSHKGERKYILELIGPALPIISTIVYNENNMAKREAVNTSNKSSRSRKTKKRLAIKYARLARKK